VIVAETGAIIALVDADDRHHRVVREIYDRDPEAWVIPWAVLPEVDYLLAEHVGTRVQDAFLADIAAGIFRIDWGDESDLARARELHTKYRSLKLGLVDGVVAAVAERLGADAIVTLDLRHLGVIVIRGNPHLLPRDVSS
jgi:hypothetical protein